MVTMNHSKVVLKFKDHKVSATFCYFFQVIFFIMIKLSISKLQKFLLQSYLYEYFHKPEYLQ